MAQIIISKNMMIVELAVNIFKEDNFFIADCPALSLCTHNKSMIKVKKSFKEALELWIETTLKKGTLKEALLSLGWQFKKIKGVSIPKPHDVNYSKVPISLLAQQYYPLNIPYSALS